MKKYDTTSSKERIRVFEDKDTRFIFFEASYQRMMNDYKHLGLDIDRDTLLTYCDGFETITMTKRRKERKILRGVIDTVVVTLALLGLVGLVINVLTYGHFFKSIF